jgi:hypothetical protein
MSLALTLQVICEIPDKRAPAAVQRPPSGMTLWMAAPFAVLPGRAPSLRKPDGGRLSGVSQMSLALTLQVICEIPDKRAPAAVQRPPSGMTLWMTAPYAVLPGHASVTPEA